jgi:hypothetical protein
MLSSYEIPAHTTERSHGLSEPTPPWALNDRTDEIRGSALAALAGTRFSSRFFAWAGVSGRRYVFSVYPAPAFPAYCDAVMLAAVRDVSGRRHVVSVRDTGAFPEAVVARAVRELRAYGSGLELHLHLLPSSPEEREATVADLAIALASPLAETGSKRLSSWIDMSAPQAMGRGPASTILAGGRPSC